MLPKPEPRQLDAPSAPDLHHFPRIHPERSPKVASDEDDSGLEPRRILHALRYHWFVIAVAGSLLGGAFAAAAWYLFPAKYTTTALLRVDSNNVGLLGSDPQTVRNEFLTFLRTQADAIRSENVLRAALRDSRIGNTETLRSREDPVRWLQENVLVEFSEHSELMKVSMTGERANECAEIVNAINQAYIKEVVMIDQLKKKTILDTLDRSRQQMEEQVKNLKLKLELNRKKVLGPDETNKLQTPTLKSQLGSAEFSRWNEEYRRAEMNFRLAEHRLQLILHRRDHVDAQQPTKEELEEALSRDPKLMGLHQKRDRLEKLVSYMRGSYANPNHPDVLSVVAQYEAAKAEAEEYHRVRSTELVRQYQAELRKALDAEVEKAKAELSMRDSARQLIKQQLDSFVPPNIELAAAKAAMNHREKDPAEYDLDESSLVYAINTYEDLLRRQNQQSVEVQASKPRVSVWQIASIPIKREMKKQVVFTLAAAMLGFVMVAAGVVVYEGRLQRVYSVRDLTDYGVPLLGTLPDISASDSVAESASGKSDPFMEGVEKVRLFLAPHVLGKRSPVVVVSSAMAGEGKTTFAGHLAVSMTRAERKTLLIDANLRRPALHEQLGLSAGPGVCELLRGDGTASDLVVRTGLNQLWFLPAGAWDSAAQHALGRDRFRRILDQLRQEFDVIIVDTNDLSTVADSYQIAQHGDALIMCTRKYVSRRPLVEHTLEKIPRLGIPHTGFVFLGESLA
ncbi:MAG: AAA family ATPase [Gemmataceae bacterium]|nr:AAA family ATPase [Gemmataceae bacterium]